MPSITELDLRWLVLASCAMAGIRPFASNFGVSCVPSSIVLSAATIISPNICKPPGGPGG